MAALGSNERYGRSTKKEPVYAEISTFPMMLYKDDRTFVVVQSQEEMDLFLAENKNKEHKIIWARSPLAFGIETAPSVKEKSEQPGQW